MVTKRTPSVAPEKVRASHILVKVERMVPVPKISDVVERLKKQDERNFMQKFVMDQIRRAKIEASEAYKQFLPPSDAPAAKPAPAAKSAPVEKKPAPAAKSAPVEKKSAPAAKSAPVEKKSAK